MDVFEELEKAGHALTLVTGMTAGVSTYYCEGCGALVQVAHEGLRLSHVPKGSWSTAKACKPAGGAVGAERSSLKQKLDALTEADYEKLKAV
jgi:hypothetical protein